MEILEEAKSAELVTTPRGTVVHPALHVAPREWLTVAACALGIGLSFGDGRLDRGGIFFLAVTWVAMAAAFKGAAEVTSTIGPLAGPPRAHEGDCLFPLEPPPPDAETLRRQEAARKLEELARRMGSTMPPDRSPTEPAVIVGVEMRRSVDEQAIAAAENIMAS